MSQPAAQPQLEYPYGPQPALEPKEHLSIPWMMRPNWLPLVALSFIGTVTNVAVVPLMDVFHPDDFGVVLPLVCLGFMFAEGFVLAAWLVWSEGGLFWRLLVHWVAATWLALAWLFGAIVADGLGSDVRDGLENVPFVLPLMSAAIQLPLWIARQYFGWRLIDQCGDHTEEKPLAIRDLLVATAIVAGSLAWVRLAEEMGGQDAWVTWAILVPSLAGISLVSVLPVAVWMLRLENLAVGVICIPVQTTIAILVTVTIAAMLERISLREVFAIAILVASFATALAGAALAARAAGYRLEVGYGTSLSSDPPSSVQHD